MEFGLSSGFVEAPRAHERGFSFPVSSFPSVSSVERPFTRIRESVSILFLKILATDPPSREATAGQVSQRGSAATDLNLNR
jgi:hypothetical protein